MGRVIGVACGPGLLPVRSMCDAILSLMSQHTAAPSWRRPISLEGGGRRVPRGGGLPLHRPREKSSKFGLISCACVPSYCLLETRPHRPNHEDVTSAVVFCA
jgi:hypothetical protein